MMFKAYILTLIVLMTGAFSFDLSNEIELPSHFPAPNYNFDNNPISKEKIALGRALFYDPILSRDSTISCASCHSPYNAFAHTDHDLSHGIDDRIGIRNAPSLVNLAWQKSFMWDGVINHLDVQALAPIENENEMDERFENVINKLQRSSMYASLFASAFGDNEITGERTLKAISQFQLTLISANSKYDKVILGNESFTTQEENGYQLFKENCNSCHVEPLFSSYDFANNGLAVDTSLNDFGRWHVTSASTDSLRFKTPTLRNLSYSYPYMHDGRFKKLNEVLFHYAQGIVDGPTLSDELKSGVVLSSNEKTDLIAFLLTLDDKEFIFNPENKFPKEILLSK